ncbi:hypothetical protein DENSPDRAFT_880629 [Dentipellis sp. KUC8613]|nr:hypothetical protein DENSPDRAFT_880629 [Dentipellis sp. KUC8613]
MFAKTSILACVALLASSVYAVPQVEERQVDSLVNFATSIAQDSGIAFASSVSVAASAAGSGNGVIASTVPGRGIGVFGPLSGSSSSTAGGASTTPAGSSGTATSGASATNTADASKTPNAAFALRSAHIATPILTSVGTVIGGLVLGAWVTL